LTLPFILLQKNMLDAFTTLIPVCVTPLFTIYVLGALTPVHRKSGLIGLLVGSLYGVFALYCREAPRIEWLPDASSVPLWLTDRWAALCWSLLVTATAMALVTLVLGTQRRDELVSTDQSGWLARSRQTLPPLCESPFGSRIPWWARPWLFATILLVLSTWLVFGVLW
jgi:hypothetical protein